MKSLFSLLLLLALFSCGNQDTNSPTPVTGDTAFRIKTLRDIEPRLFEADSIQVVFYDDPHGDSLRAYRFFSFVETAERSLIDSLVDAMDTVFVQESKTRSCRSHGKFILLKGAEIIKTVYFGLDTEPCSYFYLIRDGQFFYVPLNERGRSTLERLRTAARSDGGKRGQSSDS